MDDFGGPLKTKQHKTSRRGWLFFVAFAGFFAVSFWIGAYFYFNAPRSPYVIVDVTREDASPLDHPAVTPQTREPSQPRVTVVHGSKLKTQGDRATAFNDALALRNAPKIAVLVMDMGHSKHAAQYAISLLPSEVGFAFTPYNTPELAISTRDAFEKGHELLIQLPMEPFDYPKSDPGPKTLLSTASPTENLKRLSWLMGRFPNISGATNSMGGKLYAAPDALAPILSHLARRNLFYVSNPDFKETNFSDLAQKVGLRSLTPDLKLNGTNSIRIKDSLLRAESFLHSRKRAVFIVSPALPLALKQLSEWLEQQKKRGAILLSLSHFAYYARTSEESRTQGKTR